LQYYSVLAPELKQFAREYPEILLDVNTYDSRIDLSTLLPLVDAGIHFGAYARKDMIAVRVSPDQRPAIVGSPAYLRYGQGTTDRRRY
jgi:DNA-binding transcriptional LysR family regulator